MYERKEKLEYPKLTMFQMVERNAVVRPTAPAMDFYGRVTDYATFIAKIEQASRAFVKQGIGKKDVVTICMPNTPQALVCFYALSRIGAVANMIHPLSARDEITFYLSFSKSKMILTTDMFYEKVEEALLKVPQPVTVLVARMQDELPVLLKLPFVAKEGRKYLKYPNTEHAVLWTKFVKSGTPEVELPEHDYDPARTSVILYSGGTTGEPKGICLSEANMNACSMQARNELGVDQVDGKTVLSCMPCFHGFGLGINIHLVLIHGACCLLMPAFNIKSYANMLIKKKPNFIAGVPTIFEALLHLPDFEGVKLDFLLGMFCGGDSLPVELKKRIDEFLKEHGATIQVREGYGLTECVTASCLTPLDTYKEGSIGVAFADTTYCVVAPGTDEVMPAGQQGEIILKGPSVMLGYLDNPEATAETLKVLPDGDTWLYTGDAGYMDEEGFVYFSHRMKRMIITNGYNVYPTQIEKAIDSCDEVSYSCVIGVSDPRRMHRVKAYVVLRNGVTGDEACKARIMEKIKLQVPAYALPKEMEFEEALPRTLVGKIDYRALERKAEEEKHV